MQIELTTARRRAAALFAVCALASAGRPAGQAPAPRADVATPADLAAVFASNGLVEDTNGDGVADRVRAHLVLPDYPSAAVVAAGADIAARLGFETMAMDLPMTGAPSSPLTVRVHPVDAAWPGIFWMPGPPRAAEGVIAARQLGRQVEVLVGGGDADGTIAAARTFAARLPFLWDPKGADLGTLGKDLSQWLAAQGVEGATVVVEGLSVRAGATALDAVGVGLRVADPVAHRRVVAALRALARSRTAPATRQGAATAAPAPTAPPALSYPGVGRLALRVEAGSLSTVVEIPRVAAPETPADPPARRPGAGAKDQFDLSTLYSIDGGLGDSDGNLIPDRVDVLLSPHGDGTAATIDLAARLGLESTGVSLPLVKPAAEISKPESEPSLILIGASHPLIGKLVDAKKVVLPALAAGEGLLEVVPKAFGGKSALLALGGDAAGLSRALDQAAVRFPHLWQRGKDRPTLDDVEDDVRRFLAIRTPAGQAAAALYKLERIGGELTGRDLASAQVRVSVEAPARGLDQVVREVAARALRTSDLQVSIESRSVLEAAPVIIGGRPVSETIDIPSEVDEFWQLFRTRVLPAVKKGQPVAIEARLSESPEIRRRIEQDAHDALLGAGARAEGTTVLVLSAYKQGLSWLQEVIGPALKGQPVERVTLRYAEVGPPPEWKQQAMYAPTRWLLEAFPFDEVLARDLGLGLDRFAIEKRPIGSPAYEVVATGAGGQELLRRTFEPKFVVRPYFDRFPDYEKVRVTTGWITAEQSGRRLLDQRIVTDMERFWDHFQSRTLPAIYDYVMANGEGKPRASRAPHFGQLEVDLTLSEPDYRLGVDNEHIAPMEAMHEDIYFGVLHFFDVLGRNARGEALNYPGHVVPIMRPKNDGKPGRAVIRFTGFGAGEPSVTVEYRERNGATGRRALPLPPVTVERPAARAALVRQGLDGVARLDLRVKVDTEADERDAFVRRTRAERVDETIMSIAQVKAVVGHLGRLRAAGLYRDALAYPDLGAIRLLVGVEFDARPGADTVVALEANGVAAPLPDVRTLLPAGWTRGAGPLVQWDTPIPPGEAYELLAKMSTFPEARAYKVGRTYLGKDAWAMDLMPPIAASHWSQMKASVHKPTVIYSARQHANEVSSTSHVLKVAEMLLTDAAWRRKLDRVNVVIHPITNPDGAQLAYDLYKITPDHMLHAGYLGSLGVDVASGMWDADPIYPESGIRAKLWRTWLPDAFLNPHGYPSHEWVQLFSEYAGWVRSRATESRDWWGMRGWFIPGFGYLDDPKYPRHKAMAFELRAKIASYINAAPEVRALNQRAYARYQRYGVDQDGENFKFDLVDGVLIYTPVKGARASASSQDFASRHPQVTVFSGGTEAPDETAYGDWMKLVARAGVQFDTAVLDFLAGMPYEVERRREPFGGGVTLSLHRARPPEPRGESQGETAPVAGASR